MSAVLMSAKQLIAGIIKNGDVSKNACVWPSMAIHIGKPMTITRKSMLYISSHLAVKNDLFDRNAIAVA